MKTIGTLEEIGAQAGDVVECVTDTAALGSLTIGKYYNIGGSGCPIDNEGEQFPWTWATFRIISRAIDAPKLWRDMTPEEKGALLLAHHEGKVIEYRRYDGVWCVSDCAFSMYGKYRIRPEPKVEVVRQGYKTNIRGQFVTTSSLDHATHVVTFNTIDGKPDTTSIKMEAL